MPDGCSRTTPSDTPTDRTLSDVRYSAPASIARAAIRESSSERSTTLAFGFLERTSTTVPSGKTASAP